MFSGAWVEEGDMSLLIDIGTSASDFSWLQHSCWMSKWNFNFISLYAGLMSEHRDIEIGKS